MKRAFLVVLITGIVLCSGLSYSISFASTEIDNVQDVVKVNINNANKDELISITGIGPTLADRIIAFRDENGKFTKIDDIMAVKGIGAAKFQKIQSLITV